MVSQDILDDESEHFDCDTCPLLEAQETLDADNREAWHLYSRCRTRLVVESRLTAEVFRRLVEGWPTRDVLEVVDRMSVIHEVLNPPAPQQES